MSRDGASDLVSGDHNSSCTVGSTALNHVTGPGERGGRDSSKERTTGNSVSFKQESSRVLGGERNTAPESGQRRKQQKHPDTFKRWEPGAGGRP